MAAIRIGTVSVPQFTQARSIEHDADTLLAPGIYDVLHASVGGAWARIPGTLAKTGEQVLVRQGFGLNDTVNAFVAKVLTGQLRVDLDPAFRITSFQYAPGRVGYHVIDATGVWIHEDETRA